MSSRDEQFEREALDAFAFIASGAGPRVIDSSYSPESFGNATISLEGEHLRVRIARDRGQYFVNLSPRWIAEWFDEHTVLVLIGAPDAAEKLVKLEWRSMQPAADAIHANLLEIMAHFQPDRWQDTRTAMQGLQEKRAQDLFN